MWYTDRVALSLCSITGFAARSYVFVRLYYENIVKESRQDNENLVILYKWRVMIIRKVGKMLIVNDYKTNEMAGGRVWI